MKYMRIEDGRIIKHPHPNAEIFTFRYKIVKCADSIEDLCDEFIGINDNEHQFLRAIPYKCSNFWNNGVYGATWIDKGLIYVAKLNDKGELELI